MLTVYQVRGSLPVDQYDTTDIYDPYIYANYLEALDRMKLLQKENTSMIYTVVTHEVKNSLSLPANILKGD
jgi:hypothetical protein